LVPRLPFWLEVVTESDEVAVVVPCGFSILAVQSQWVNVWNVHVKKVVSEARWAHDVRTVRFRARYRTSPTPTVAAIRDGRNE
jgi:hypothetical protein